MTPSTIKKSSARLGRIILVWAAVLLLPSLGIAQTWTAQSSGTTQDLWGGVWGSDANNVWAVGNGGTILKWNGSVWSAQSSGTTKTLWGVWGSDANNVWAVGDDGTILKWDGTTWSAQTSGTLEDFWGGVWGSDANNVWVAGTNGIILKWNGSVWAAQSSGITNNFYKIRGVDANNVWAVGTFGAIRKWNGSTWTAQTSGTGLALFDVWGIAANNVWAVTSNNTILKWNGSVWSTQISGTTQLLRGVWGSDANNVWAVGNSGTILKQSGGGTSWSAQTSGTTQNLAGIWGSNFGNIWAVGTGGTILYSNDQLNCTSFTFTAPTITQPTCSTPTGTIVVNATGSATLEYSVDNGSNWQSSATFSGQAPGNYNIKVRLQANPTCEAAYGSNPVVLTPPFIASATTLYVDQSVSSSGNGTTWATALKTLDEALTIAHNCSGVATINVAAGTYKPTLKPYASGVPITTADARDVTFHLPNGVALYGGFPNGGGTRNIAANPTILSGDFNGDDIITGSGAGISISNVSDNFYHVVLSVSDAATTILDGFTVRGGIANGSSNITVEGVSIVRNAGGGMYNHASSPTITNVIFTGNDAPSSPGGGGINNVSSSAPAISNCTFTRNNANSGGGIRNNNSSPTISNCSFIDNRGGSGGGIAIETGSSPTISNCTFTLNWSSNGGGIRSTSATPPTITNCTFINNGGSNGAGLHTGAANISNCTFFGNNAGTLGDDMVATSATIVNNCIIWGNVSGISGTPTVTNSIVQGGYSGCTNCPNTNGNANPIFVNAADPDGADNIHRTADDGIRLQVGSPAINAGDNTLIPSGITTDIAGTARIQNTTVDLGAYEGGVFVCPTATTLYVNQSVSSSGDGTSWATAFKTLQEALTAANSCPSITQIWVAKGTYYPDEGGSFANNDRNASFTMKNDVAIYGGFSGNGTETLLSQRNWTTNPTILSGDIDKNNTLDNGNSYHVIYNNYTSITPLTSTSVLDGFSITGGSANGSGFLSSGAGMYNFNSSPSITNCSFSGNSADQIGGGMYNSNSSPTVTNCSFSGNSANAAGGGISNIGSGSIPTPSITNCSFSGNSATQFGGGIYNGSASPIITNCTFSGNSSPGQGGGMASTAPNINSPNPVVKNCIFWGNSSEIYLSSGFTAVTYSIVKQVSGVFSGTGNLNVDPLFVNSSDADGADNVLGTADDGLRLQGCSPAIDAGTSTGAPTTDILGNARVDAITGGNIVDMGAYEYQSTLQEINLQGGSPLANISDGDIAPTTTKGTDFENVGVGSNVAKTFTIQNTGTGPLTISSIFSSSGLFVVGGLTLPATITANSSATFTVTFSPTATGPQNATITVNNDDCDEAVYDFVVTGTGAIPDYSITTTGNAIVITDISGNGETLQVSESGGNIRFNITPTTRTYSIDGGPITVFTTPADVSLAGATSITINTAAGTDIINFSTFATNNLPSLTVNGGTGDDAVNFNGDITFAANANLDVDLQNDDASPGIDLVTVASIADIALSGTGTATVKVSKSFTMNGGTFSTTNGNLIVEANQQATPTSGTFNGVDINAGQLQCSGTGNVTVKGKGGDNGINQRGVYVHGTAGILSSSSGTTTVIGTGGVSSNDRNFGVEVNGSTAKITSFGGGNVSVTGQGGGSGASLLNIGVYVQSSGNISAGGSGALTIQGTGGAGSGGGNYGVYVSNASVSSSNGNVSVTGVAGGTGTSISDYGIYAQNSSTISAGGSGSLTVQGTGGPASGGGCYGVGLANSATFTSGGGNVQVTGQGGGTGSNGANRGISLNGSCVITAGGMGTVTVQGTGGNTSGDGNTGVSIANTSSITSSGGSVSVTGTGSSNGTSSFNFGVSLNNICLIKAGGSGTVSVAGNGANSSGNQNGGIVLTTGDSQITSTGGNVQVTGTAGGVAPGSSQIGVWLASTGQISAGGSGTVTVTGNGGNGAGSQNYGVYVTNASSQISSSGGPVSITGQEGAGSVGINTTSSGIITTATNGGNITLIANSMNIGAAVSTNGSSSVIMRPYTNGVQINLGSASNPIGGPLSLSDAELDLMTTGTLIIGDAAAGAITVSADISRPAVTNVQLISSGDVSLSGGGINTGGGTLLLDPGTSPAAVKPTFNATDATASTLSFGSDLAIVINGTTAGDGTGSTYSQLTVAGAVNLTGVDLILSGAHTPVLAQTFTIVDNDGSDAITGTFTGLAQGATITNFLGSGLNATISYTGGTGNDVVLTVIAACPATGSIWYVNAAAAPGGNGASWGCAFQDLQSALTAAGSGHQVWVAKGTYYPDEGGSFANNDRNASFTMKNDVAIYGGFSGDGSETLLSQRNWATNPTILSGDIDKNNTLDNGNSYHVIFNNFTSGSPLTNSAVLDGFTIANGNANGSGTTNRGGGMYNAYASPSLSNVTFSDNKALTNGGAINNTNSTPQLTNCIFQSNTVSGGNYADGGAIYNNSSSPSILNCSFLSNSASGTFGSFGGAIRNVSSSSPQITNCLFQGNSASGATTFYNYGGAISNENNSNPQLTNCAFLNNSASGTAPNYGGAIAHSSSGNLVLLNCSFQSNSVSGGSTNQGGAIYNGGGTQLTNCVLFGNGGSNTFSGSVTANYSLFDNTVTGYSGSNNLGVSTSPFTSTSSMALANCSPAIDAGTSTGAPITDILGNARVDAIAGGNIVDMGAYEYQSVLQLQIQITSVNSTPIICQNDGTITAVGSTPCQLVGTVTYSINGVGGNTANTTGIFIGLPSGNYTVTVYDSGNPTNFAVTTVTVSISNTAPVVTAIATSALCNGGNGTIALTVANGTAPYDYVWDGPGANDGSVLNVASHIITPAPPGTYAITATDANGCQTTTSAIVTEPTTKVQGNGIDIADGDATPSASDHTDFGTTNIGVGFARTFTIQNTGGAPFSISSITSNNPRFAVSGAPTSVAANSSATFMVTFTPTVAGAQNATITVNNDNCVYDFAVTGTGIAPTPTLGTYPNTSMIAGQNASITPSAAPTNATSIVAYTHTPFTGVLVVNPTTGVLTVTKALQAGVYAVTVRAFNGAASTTTTFTLTVTNPTCSQGTFGGTTDVAVGLVARSVAVGDFNGDGKQDFAAANLNSNTVSIRLGDGAGGFSGTTDVSVGTNPGSVAVGDFNGDGKQDIAAANRGSSSVSIRLGDGAGGFSGTTNVSVGSSPYSVAVGDFNGDGKQDFATANLNSNTVTIRLGNGLGGFSGTTDVGVGTAPITVAVGDFNGDGNQDIASTNYSYSSNTVSIRLGDGAGGFSGTTEVAVGSQPYSVAVGYFNGDGRQDIAVANRGSNSVSIRLGDGAGGFSGTTDVGVGTAPSSVAVGDFNGDGKQDFAAANVSSNTVSIRLGDGLGTFSGTTNVGVGTEPVSVAVGDFNGDGKQDIAAANYVSNTVSIRLGGVAEINLQGGSPLTNIPDGDIAPTTTKGTDFENVGVGSNVAKTFTIQNTGGTTLNISSIASNNGLFTVSGLTLPATIAASGSTTFTLTFTPTATGAQNATITVNSNDCDEAVYDFVVTGTGVGPTLGTYPATSMIAGQNASITPSAAPTNATSIVAYTNNNTNTPFTGVLVVNPTTGVLTVTKALQAGVYVVTVRAFNGAASTTTTFTLTVTNPTCSQGTFGGTTNVSVGTSPFSVAVGDFNGDGKQDIATANYTVSGTVSIRLGDGTGGFSGTTNVSVGSTPWSVAVGDFNGDGKQDIAAANFGTGANSVSIRLGDGAGGFSGTTDVAVGSRPISVAVGDFNGDGKQDIAAANYGSGANSVSIRLGDGTGGFSGTTDVSVGTNPGSVAVGDFNGDGKQDFAAANYNSSSVSIRLGDGAGGFSGTTNVSVGTAPASVAVGDFNGDGKQDIAAANAGSISNSVSILLGDGMGGFSGTTNVAVGISPQSVAVGDFNGDGKQDFAVANYNSSSVSFRLGDGAGGFSGTTNVSVGTQPISVAVGDFNGDGRQDFAAANAGSATVSIRLGVVAEINLQGGSPLANIPDGDTAPTTAKGTDFGNVNVSSNAVKTFTIQNTDTGPLTISSIGSNSGLFTVSGLTLPATITANSSATFTVTFSPTATGAQNATITVNNDDCDEAVYDFAVTGTGICPDLTAAAPAVQVTNSTCATFGATPTGGVIAAPTGTCPAGSTLQYSTDNGMNWSITLPTYAQSGPAQTILTRCNCDANTATSSPTSSVTTVPGTCPLCPVLTAAAPAAQVTNSTCATFGATPTGGIIAAPAGTCPAGSTLQYSTDNGMNWSITLPTYAQSGPAQTILTRCNCDANTATSSPTSSVTTVPGTCPLCPVLTAAAPAVQVTNSTCATFGATPTGGIIAAPTGTCPTGSTLQYSTDNGMNWSITLPTYAQSGPAQTILTRCNCDANTATSSPTSSVTTVPGTCPLCPVLTAAAPVVQVTNSTCATFGATPTGGVIAAPTGTCPAGSTLQYSTDNGMNWSITLPTYAQSGPAQTIKTRCLCDADPTQFSPESSVTTVPGTVPALNIPTNGAATVACPALAIQPTPPVVNSCNGSPITPSGPVVTNNPNPLTCEGTRTYTFTYSCGSNTATWSFVYTIERQPFTVPTDGAATVACLAQATTPTPPTVLSNCGEVLTPSPAIITDSPTSLTCEGTRTYAYTYTDCEGNTATWSFVYTIERLPFTIATPNGAATVYNPALATPPTPPVVLSNCGETLTPSAPVITNTPNPLLCEGTRTYAYTYTDCEGNTATWSFVYTVIDNIPPQISCPTNLTVCQSTTVTYTPPVGTDNCIGAATLQIAGLPSGSVFPVGVTTNTFQVTATNNQTATCSFTVTVNPLPTASISGTVEVCQNAPFPQITFTGGNGTAPYTFTYKINGGADLTITTSSGNSVSLNQTTAAAGTFVYSLVSVKDASSTQCSQSQSGSATITVNPLPLLSFTGPNPVCQGLNSALSANLPGAWTANDPSKATIAPDGTITTLTAGTATFTFTVAGTGCQATTSPLTIKPTPTSALTASKYDVCPNTPVTLNPNCSIPTATVNWNPGGPTVTPDAATVPYIYKARCVADGCVGNETSVEVRTHRILVDMKDLDVGALPLPIVRSVIDNMAPTNQVNAPVFPRRWTFIANGCEASESAVFKLLGPVNFNAIDNAGVYAMFANDSPGGNLFYSIDHPNYGNGGSFPNGTYTLTIDLRSQDGVGGPFPKNRVAVGSLLATRTLQFTVGSPAARQAVGSELWAVGSGQFAEVAPNPVSNIMRLKVTDAKGQKVNVSLLDASGRTMLKRDFVPETHQHQEEFNVGDITNGMYFLRVNTADKNATLKVVKVE